MKFHATTMSTLKSADALILPLFEEGPAQVRGLSRALQNAYERAAGDDATRILYHRRVQLLDRGGVGRIVVVNAGKRRDFNLERARRVVSAGVRALWDTKVRSVAVALDGAALDGASAVRAAVEGVHFAQFRPEFLRTEERLRHLPPIGTVQVAVGDPREVAGELARADVIGQAVDVGRPLSNMPANQMTPTILSSEARALAKDAGIKIEVLDEKQCAKLGMNSYLSVAHGSHEPPRFIVLRYTGRAGSGYDFGIVGKGITFDSGGISLK